MKNIKQRALCNYIVIDMLYLIRKIILLIKNVKFTFLNAGIEVHLVDHCNLKCASCSHFSPLAKISFVDVNLLENDYKKFAQKENGFFKRIRLLGGEPLLHPEINRIIKITRQYFPKKKITLVTNGILLNKMDNLFFEILKKNNVFLKITEYPINMDYRKVEQLLIRNNVWFKIKKIKENKKFLKPNLSERPYKDYESNYLNCSAKFGCNQLRNGKLYSCFFMAYFDLLKDKFNLTIDVEKSDFINLEDIHGKLFLWKFVLTSKKFCQYCGIHKNVYEQWRSSRCCKDEWISF